MFGIRHPSLKEELDPEASIRTLPEWYQIATLNWMWTKRTSESFMALYHDERRRARLAEKQ